MKRKPRWVLCLFAFVFVVSAVLGASWWDSWPTRTMDRIARLVESQNIAELNRIFDGVTWSESSGHLVARFGEANKLQRLPESWAGLLGERRQAGARKFWDRVEGRAEFLIKGINAIAPDELSYSSFDPPVASLSISICRGRAETNFELLPSMILVD